MLTLIEPLKENNQVYPQSSINTSIAVRRDYLETVLRLYYLRHGFQYFDAIILVYMVALGSTAIEGIKTSPLSSQQNRFRSTLILCAKGIHDQGMNFHFGKFMFRLICNRMGPEDISLLNQCAKLEELDESESLKTEYIESEWPNPFMDVSQESNSWDSVENIQRG
jgi:hypothetical protein